VTRIVTTAYRYKPPPRKRKAVALAGPAIVRKAVSLPTDGQRKPGNDDRKPAPALRPTDETKSAIVTTTSRKREKFQNGTAEPDPEAASVNPTGGNKAAIVTVRRPGARRVNVPDLTPEEYQRRGDAADALWRELVRRATSKDQP
jgi:hypothetical protein